MTTMKKLLLPFIAVLLLAWAGLVLGQNSPGGSFVPGNDYTVGGIWTWRGNATPFVFEGTTDDSFETSVTVTNPTADRAVTLQNAPGVLVLGPAATSGAVEAGTVSTTGTTNPTRVTTSLSTLAACTVQEHVGTSPGLGPVTFTTLVTAVAGRLDIYAWSATSSSDPTLIATLRTAVARWVCIGTR